MGEGQATKVKLRAQPRLRGLHQAAEHVEDGENDESAGDDGANTGSFACRHTAEKREEILQLGEEERRGNRGHCSQYRKPAVEQKMGRFKPLDFVVAMEQGHVETEALERGHHHENADGQGDLTEVRGSQPAQKQDVGGPVDDAGEVDAADHLNGTAHNAAHTS